MPVYWGKVRWLVNMEKILIVEDDLHIIELLRYNLEQAGFGVGTVSRGGQVAEKVQAFDPDLILLDIMLPEMDGIEICRQIKHELKLEIPIIMLTAKSEELDKILGLEMGADDYVTKPFSVRELITRVKVVLRRYQQTTRHKKSGKLRVDGLLMDLSKRETFVNDAPVELTYKEFELLRFLVESRGKVLDREMLLQEIWGYAYAGETRTVDVHILHLRKKLDPSVADRIQTVRGVGYKYD